MKECHTPLHFLDLTAETILSGLKEICGQLPDYRGVQILSWIYKRYAASFSEMTDLSKELRQRLGRQGRVYTSKVVVDQLSGDGTRKFLLRWPGGDSTECVLIPSQDRYTACISTQVGCPVKCAFCASGLDGWHRHLAGGEIVEQALRVAKLCYDQGASLSNVVVMGLGEPLANYDATIRAIRTINADWGMGIGARKITISTVGMPKQIRQLAEEKLQLTLALSLHAPNDELRRRLIPWAQRVSIKELLAACQYYFDRTGREVTLEYILLGEVNDLPQHIQQLANISRLLRSKVNLIPYNPVEGLEYRRPENESIQRFEEGLKTWGVNVQVRKPRGMDIDAACGQLRRRFLDG